MSTYDSSKGRTYNVLQIKRSFKNDGSIWPMESQDRSYPCLISVLTLILVPREIPPNAVPDIVEDELMVYDQDIAIDPVIKEILSLIEAQVRYVRQSDLNGKIAEIVLVGGLGSNDYLRERVISHFKNEYNVVRPVNALRWYSFSQWLFAS